MSMPISRKKNKYNAFSLMELLVAMFIFVIVTTVVIGTFGNMVNVKKKAKNVQQNLENTKYAMELMAKSIRMSSKTDYITPENDQSIFMYNSSEGKCVSYQFSGGSLQRGVSGEDYDSCVSGSSFTYTQITPENITGKFAVTPSNHSRMGKVTISIVVSTGNGSSSDTIRSQTTVSLRSYDEVGI